MAPASIQRRDQRQLFGRQAIALGRHLGHGVVTAGDGLEQQAFVGLAGHDRRAAVAAGQQRSAMIQPQARLLLVGAVAIKAVGRQDRTNVAREIDGLLGRRQRSTRGQGQHAQTQNPNANRHGSPEGDPRRHVLTPDAGRSFEGRSSSEGWCGMRSIVPCLEVIAGDHGS